MARTTTKHMYILETLRQRIVDGEFRPGDRLPPDVELVQEFEASRPTVAKAVSELERCGLVRRRRGSGTYVQKTDTSSSHLFGLLIPGLGETEIFEPICGELARAAQSDTNALLWGGGFETSYASEEQKEQQARSLCEQYVRNEVSGVFFAPLELTGHRNEINHEVIERLADANIAVVLLDRDYLDPPGRSRFDLVGIDNHRAGRLLGNHLIETGCKRISFVARRGSASTIDQRFAGIRDAVLAAGLSPDAVWDRRLEPEEFEADPKILLESDPDVIACGNDATAAKVMHALNNIGVDVPEQVMVTGIDDVRYSSLLRVPLTTVRQPCAAIGRAAYDTMLSRLARPDDPARDVLVNADLVTRASTQRRAGKRGGRG